MSAESTLAVLAALERAEIDVVVDGGWGVDALLGVERRAHDDLDLIVPLARVPDAVSAVRRLGYVPVADTLPVTLVLAAPGGRRVDLHPTVVNEHGDQAQAQPFGRSFRVSGVGARRVGVDRHCVGAVPHGRRPGARRTSDTRLTAATVTTCRRWWPRSASRLGLLFARR